MRCLRANLPSYLSAEDPGLFTPRSFASVETLSDALVPSDTRGLRLAGVGAKERVLGRGDGVVETVCVVLTAELVREKGLASLLEDLAGGSTQSFQVIHLPPFPRFHYSFDKTLLERDFALLTRRDFPPYICRYWPPLGGANHGGHAQRGPSGGLGVPAGSQRLFRLRLQVGR